VAEEVVLLIQVVKALSESQEEAEEDHQAMMVTNLLLAVQLIKDLQVVTKITLLLVMLAEAVEEQALLVRQVQEAILPHKETVVLAVMVFNQVLQAHLFTMPMVAVAVLVVKTN
jgi:hypothetical protein